MGICGESSRKKNLNEKTYNNSNDKKESNIVNNEKYFNHQLKSKEIKH
jgi:hypothetical protein